MLSYSIGGNAMDFASCVSKCESSCQLSESSSDIKSNSSLNSRAVGFDKSSQSLTISDVELGFKSVSETSSNNGNYIQSYSLKPLKGYKFSN